MKSRTYSLLIFAIVFSIIMGFIFSAWGTAGGGIIDTDKTWIYASYPYTLFSNTQVTEEEFPWVIFYPAFAVRKNLTTSITYNITVKPGAPGQVEAVLEGVNKSAIEFLMYPDWTGGDILGNVFNVKATGSDGTLLTIAQLNNGWRVRTSGYSKIILRYNFGTHLLQDPYWEQYVIIVTDIGAFFLNGAILAYPDINLQNIFIVFDAPTKWTVGTSFIPEGSNTFRVEGVPDFKTDLLYNVTRLGDTRAVVSGSCDDLEITFIDYGWHPGYEEFWYSNYGNTREEQMHEYINLVCNSIRYFKPIFGKWAGGKHYWISTSATGGGESPSAWMRWMQPWPRERYQQLPHHIYHAWIWAGGETCPLKFWGGAEWWWIYEGIPTFYEKKLTPLLTGNSIWQGMSYISYLITKRAAQFGLLHKHTINKYAYSEMRSLSIDREISRATNDEKSIDDLISLLWERYGRFGKPFYRNELIQAINDIAETDLSSFYNKYIAGEVSSEIPPVDDYMLEVQSNFLNWIDAFVSSTGRGSAAKGSRTIFFISLEISIHSGEGLGSEHFIATGGGLVGLEDFKDRMKKVDYPIKEKDVISVLSSITGVSEDDFFDFYTVGNYSPSVDEIKMWLNE